MGIQFISFGQDPVALARMDKLDAGLGLEMYVIYLLCIIVSVLLTYHRDIVDHERSNGNVWKMILGAIDPDFDDDDDDEGDEGADIRSRR